jgi:hypothetical protein
LIDVPGSPNKYHLSGRPNSAAATPFTARFDASHAVWYRPAKARSEGRAAAWHIDNELKEPGSVVTRDGST